jgi:hypothetical protein
MPYDHVAHAGRQVEHRAVLTDDHVDTGQVTNDPVQVRQPSTCHEHDHDPASACTANRLADERIEDAVDGDRAVAVECKGRAFHASAATSSASCRWSVLGGGHGASVEGVAVHVELPHPAPQAEGEESSAWGVVTRSATTSRSAKARGMRLARIRGGGESWNAPSRGGSGAG